MKIAIEAPNSLYGCFPFFFVISKVMTSHENALLGEQKNRDEEPVQVQTPFVIECHLSLIYV